MSSSPLDPAQASALLDILSHYELYDEILDFRYPEALAHYGPPFQEKSQTPSTSPSLQALVSKFVLNLPGIKDISDEFWEQRVYSILQRFQEADLSESYDKGHVSIRKTLATACSALIEYPVRGVFAGFDDPGADGIDREYDESNAQDLHFAFRDLLHRAVYGQVIDELVQKIGETDKLSDHTPLVQGAHEFALVNVASFMHYALIISPKGQSLLALIEQANKLVPYLLIKQTLRIGNVATMINAMVKVVLAKMSVTSMTNWIGLTQNQDEGMNLMQHIIAQVLQWDNRDLRNKASKVEKEKNGLSKDQLSALKEYPGKTRDVHEEIRNVSSSESRSVIAVILSKAAVPSELSKEQHQMAQEYLSMQLSIRDRENIIQALCHSQPDHLTNAVRDLVTAYEPLIRQLHQAVDLSDTLNDFEAFVRDTIKLSKLPDLKSNQKPQKPPTVGDFVQLLKKHRYSVHKFLHQVVKNGRDITMWFHEYALQAVSYFRRTSSTSISSGPNAGDLTDALNELFASLSEQQRTKLAPILTDHATYLSKVHAASIARLQLILESSPSNTPVLQTGYRSWAASLPSSRSSSPAPANRTTSAGLSANPGPGAFLAKWQDLIDTSEITPAVPEGGKVRKGTKGSVLKASRVGTTSKGSLQTSSQSNEGNVGSTRRGEVEAKVNTSAPNRDNDNDSDDEDVFEEAYERLDQFALRDEDKMAPPDVSPVMEALGSGYREMLAKKTLSSA